MSAPPVLVRYKRSTDVAFTDLFTNPVGLWFTIVRGLWEPADTRGEDDVLLGLRGRFRRNRQGDRRRLVISGEVIGTGATWAAQLEDFQTRMLDLQGLLDVTDYGTLEAELADSTQMQIGAWPLSDWGVVPHNPAAATVTIGLESIDPDWSVVT